MENHRAQEIREKRVSDPIVIGIRLQHETTAARSDGVCSVMVKPHKLLFSYMLFYENPDHNIR